MTQFHVGQEVEVAPLSKMFGVWRAAKITYVFTGDNPQYKVEFPGDRAVFGIVGNDDIRAVDCPAEDSLGSHTSGPL